jgi:predicted secreted Zn-dependent protease
VSARRLGLGFLCALALAAAACGGGGDRDGGSPSGHASGSGGAVESEGIKLETGQATSYYDVQGLTTEDIFRYIEQNGPTLEDGTRGSGITSVVWAYDWTGSQDGGGCKIDSMTIRADIAVLLPRHANEAALPASLRKNWEAYEEGVAVHEQRHVDIYLDGAQDIKTLMSEIGRQKDCSTLETKVETVWSDEQDRINGLQQAFHHEEDLRLAAKRQPLEALIQANRTKLNGLQSQISSLERRISSLKSELNSLDAQLDSVEAQIEQISDYLTRCEPASKTSSSSATSSSAATTPVSTPTMAPSQTAQSSSTSTNRCSPLQTLSSTSSTGPASPTCDPPVGEAIQPRWRPVEPRRWTYCPGVSDGGK